MFDQLILDPTLTATASQTNISSPGWMHGFIVSSLLLEVIGTDGDAFSTQAIDLCREVFGGGEMMSDDHRAN